MMGGIKASSSTRDLAERLINFESELDRTLQVDDADTCHVCEKLRRSLGRLVGSEAYRSLISRALVMAKRESSLLRGVHIKEDGSIAGLTGEATQATNILVAHLIGLMRDFIGEPVTLWLLDDLWPDLPGCRIRLTGEEQARIRDDTE